MKAWLARWTGIQIDEYRDSHLNPANRVYHAGGIPAFVLSMFTSAYIGLRAESLHWQAIGFTVAALLAFILITLFFFGGWRGIVTVLALGPMSYLLTTTEFLAHNFGWLILGGLVVFNAIGITGLFAGKAANEKRALIGICMITFALIALFVCIYIGIEKVGNLEASPGTTALVLFFVTFYYHTAGHACFEGREKAINRQNFVYSFNPDKNNIAVRPINHL